MPSIAKKNIKLFWKCYVWRLSLVILTLYNDNLMYLRPLVIQFQQKNLIDFMILFSWHFLKLLDIFTFYLQHIHYNVVVGSTVHFIL